MITVNYKWLPHGEGLSAPAFATPGSAGLDICAAVDAPIFIKPLERVLVPTGFTMELPAGYEAQLRPRSGLALKHGITILNSPGTIDSDYRGEVKVLLINLGSEPFEVTRGARIAQMVIAAVTPTQLSETTILSDSQRGAGGYGSTGK